MSNRAVEGLRKLSTACDFACIFLGALGRDAEMCTQSQESLAEMQRICCVDDANGPNRVHTGPRMGKLAGARRCSSAPAGLPL